MPSILEQAVIDKVFPCAVWRVYRKGKLFIEEAVGTLIYESSEPATFKTVFDLASVSKPFTSCAILILASRGQIDLQQPASYYLPEIKGQDKDEIKVEHLLLHNAGLFADPELHKIYCDKRALLEQIFSRPLVARPGEKVAYTSIGYQYLGCIIERVAETSLANFIKDELFDPLNLQVIDYLPNNKVNIAPTEFSAFRDRLLVGEVHDDNCYTLGGVGGHTGLFSNVEDVCRFGLALLDKNNPIITDPWRQLFFTNYTRGAEQERSLAFIVNNSEFGQWDEPTFSHTGFTGTSIFLVPDKDIVSVLLTNRVYPTRENEKIVPLRRELHEWLKHRLEEKE